MASTGQGTGQGRYRLTIGGVTSELRARNSYTIPRNDQHSVEILEQGEVVDIFTLPRVDRLRPLQR